MLAYPEIDPVALSLGPFELFGKVWGPLEVHWYGITYLLAFAAAWAIARRRCNAPFSPIKKEQIDDLIVYIAFGTIIGGRMGYVMFYYFDRFLDDPIWLFKLWDGGMSFHGGFIGVAVATWLYAKRHKISYMGMWDFIAPMAPLGLGFGRIGNFIGQELWGRASDVPWAMVFPKAGAEPRHPSQLYEAFLEGLVLFVIVYWFSSRPRPAGAVAGVFLVGYGVFRSLVEFTREPDAHIEFDLFGWVSRGQILSLPMILVGIGLLVWAYKGTHRRRLRATT